MPRYRIHRERMYALTYETTIEAASEDEAADAADDLSITEAVREYIEARGWMLLTSEVAYSETTIEEAD